MEKVQLKTLEPNENINDIRGLIDLVTDEYGNYYYPVTTKVGEGKLLEVTLSHAYYEDAFSEIFFSGVLQDEIPEEYRNKHIGLCLQDRLTSSLERLEKSKRRIFTIQELLANGTKVSTMKLTETHPRAK
ncbi:TPA: hypothetical protein QCZ07_005343 [Bacillus cereus]|nr:hypothetical protein [Bacillus cereus]